MHTLNAIRGFELNHRRFPFGLQQIGMTITIQIQFQDDDQDNNRDFDVKVDPF